MKALFFGLVLSAALFAAGTDCDLRDYKTLAGINASVQHGALMLTWQGERGQDLRAGFSVHDGQPIVDELAVRKPGGAWVKLGSNLTPEYEVTTGNRRMSEQQLAPLRALNIPLTPELIDREQWNAFWDAPLMVPGSSNTNVDLPRKPEEIRRDWAKFRATGCSVVSDGARVEVTFPGVTLGIFAGELRYTAYRGSNLLRQEVIAKTSEPRVAYKYVAGLKGFSIAPKTRVVWKDVARNWQQYAFGGAANHDPVPLIARNRVAIAEEAGGSIAVLPPPHKFFFAREIETNLGFVYYRKDDDRSFAIGARQADREQPYRPYGVSDTVWKRRADEARHDINNFALYNAPPGTMQRMPVYFYLNAGDGEATDRAVLAYTHDDHYKEMPGYKVVVSHFHMHFNEQLTDAGTLDEQPSWYSVFRGLGVNAVILADFHSDSHPNDPGPIRFKEQQVYYQGCERFSDHDFLLLPGEEPDATLGGHYMFVFPHPLYWSHVRAEGQQYEEKDAKYGDVFHTASPGDELKLLEEQNGYMWQTHPRTKGSAGYPDAVKDWPHYRSDRFIGGSYQSLPVDQSEKRICEARCFGLLDDMNNWGSAKYMIAEGDTYMKYPEDETYPQLAVNYVKLDRVPLFKESWTPLLKSLRDGNYFVSTGELLLRNWSISGSASQSKYIADVDWTFPLEFVELVWGDGTKTGRVTIPATDLAPFGNKRFEIPFDARDKKWIRFAVWDSAGNGAFTQPVHLE